MTTWEPPTHMGTSLALVACFVVFIPYLTILRRSLSTQKPLPTWPDLVLGCVLFAASATLVATKILPYLLIAAYIPNHGIVGTSFRLVFASVLLCFLITMLQPAQSVAIRLHTQLRFRKHTALPQTIQDGVKADHCESKPADSKLDEEDQREQDREETEAQILQLLECLVVGSMLLVIMELLSAAAEDLESPLRLIVAAHQHPQLRFTAWMLPTFEIGRQLYDAVNHYIPRRWRNEAYDTPGSAVSKFDWRRGVLPRISELTLAIPYWVLHASLLIPMIIKGAEYHIEPPSYCDCKCNQ